MQSLTIKVSKEFINKIPHYKMSPLRVVSPGYDYKHHFVIFDFDKQNNLLYGKIGSAGEDELSGLVKISLDGEFEEEAMIIKP